MLTLPIKKKWFDMIKSGEKKEEYREIKIKKWTDYDGEQIQIWDKEGNYYLVSSVNCALIKD